MKFIKLTFILILLNPLNSHAGFRDVVSKSCDGEAVQVQSGERFFFDRSHSIVGFGKNVDGECKRFDFFLVFVAEEALVDLPDGSKRSDLKLEGVQSSGARNSCKEGLLEGQALFFKSIQLSGDQLQILGTSDCDKLTIELAPEVIGDI